jgi:hypothetical protein
MKSICGRGLRPEIPNDGLALEVQRVIRANRGRYIGETIPEEV